MTLTEAKDGRACASGISIATPFGQICTNKCLTHADCTVYGWGCKQRIEMGDGKFIGLCMPRRIPPSFR